MQNVRFRVFFKEIKSKDIILAFSVIARSEAWEQSRKTAYKINNDNIRYAVIARNEVTKQSRK